MTEPIKQTKPVICKCLRCGHTWATRGGNTSPRICPKCKSAYWDTARRTERQDGKEDSNAT